MKNLPLSHLVVRYVFMSLVLPLIHALVLSVIYTVGEKSLDARTLVMYLLIINAIPFLAAQAIFSVWIVWKRLSHGLELFGAFAASHVAAVLVYALWPRPGTYVDGVMLAFLAANLALITLAFGLAWACWLAYDALIRSVD